MGMLDILMANAGILRHRSFESVYDDLWDVVPNVRPRGA